MNYLNICRAVRILSGAQGSGPLSVESGGANPPTGYEINLVSFVDNAYIEIQNSRSDFKFMRDSTELSTIIGQATYDTDDLSSPIPSDIKTIGSIRLLDSNGKWHYLTELQYDEAEFRFMNTSTNSSPKYFSREPGATDAIKLYPTPSEVQTLHMEYWIKPETMTTDAQIPKLPEEFHQAIVYKASEKMANFLGNVSGTNEYKEAYRVLFQRLCSTQVPAKDFRPRGARATRGFAI